jgi:hypothetical protein
VLDVSQAVSSDNSLDNFPLNEALRLKVINGLTYRELEKMFGVDHSTIHYKLRPYVNKLGIQEQANRYAEREGQILKFVESELLIDLLDPAKRASATLNNTAYAFSQVANARRLAECKPTAIIDTRSAVLQIQTEKEELKAMLAGLKNEVVDVDCDG